ncbi:hypothetical protein [Nocardia sp. NBC_01327]|uniref:hypothetical protein n=1 Tax=Nocardia sp. NBC_01327 TaxID=2903593 RepID=UPI002E0EED87|nr:hypothetical protein OG326_22915 [Nocardia sp. NBC_01327]
MAAQTNWRETWIGQLFTIAALLVGVVASIGIVVGCQRGQWFLVVLSVVVLAVCIPIVVPAVLADLLGQVMLAVMILTVPLLIVPRGRSWWLRTWGPALAGFPTRKPPPDSEPIPVVADIVPAAEELEELLGMMDADVPSTWSKTVREQLSVPRFLELNPEFPVNARAQYAHLLESRWMTTVDFFDLTGVSIEDDDLLYDFLARSYRYIFENIDPDDLEEQPATRPWDTSRFSS